MHILRTTVYYNFVLIIQASIRNYLIICYQIILYAPFLLEIKYLPKTTDLVNLETVSEIINTLRQRQNGRHFADDIFKCNS